MLGSESCLNYATFRLANLVCQLFTPTAMARILNRCIIQRLSKFFFVILEYFAVSCGAVVVCRLVFTLVAVSINCLNVSRSDQVLSHIIGAVPLAFGAFRERDNRGGRFCRPSSVLVRTAMPRLRFTYQGTEFRAKRLEEESKN